MGVIPSFFRKENLDEHRLKNIFLDFSDFICYNKTIKRKEVNQNENSYYSLPHRNRYLLARHSQSNLYRKEELEGS